MVSVGPRPGVCKVNVNSRTSPDRGREFGASSVDLAALGSGRLVLQGSLAPGELDLPEHGIRQIELLVWSGFLERNNSEYRLSGEVVTVVEMECVRCLDPVRESVRREFDLLFQHRESLIYAEHEELALLQSDTRISFLTGSELPLNELMREQVLLALPMKPLCRSECPGLCPVCGIHLNNDSCECSLQEINPAFEVLGEFKKQLENPI